jgi:hypothetical protein
MSAGSVCSGLNTENPARIPNAESIVGDARCWDTSTRLPQHKCNYACAISLTQKPMQVAKMRRNAIESKA